MRSKHQQLNPLPTLLQQTSNQYLETLLQTGQAEWDKLDQESKSRLEAILGLSDFAAEHLCRHPEWMADVLTNPSEKPTQYLSELVQVLEKITDEDEAKKTLRHYRHRQMVTLACQDFLNLSPLSSLLIQISELAEALIIAARDWLYCQLCKQYGTPCDKQGNPQPLLILGMGKLGGKELNFSSDIDLIFVFPEHGETLGGRRQLDNQQFFTRMGQKLVKLLDQLTCDGFVFRVDMRLRPYGDSGPLVVSSSGFEDYYQEQGRDWERYAMVKARVLGPQTIYGDALQQLLRPFVYRRYIDFSAIEALRKMKLLITREVRRRKLTDNIKLGAGGIREVEFVVQSFQLIRGGREQRLRCQSLYQALQTLGALGLLTAKIINELEHNYSLLRRIENLLQAMADKQTQTLPDNALGWQRLCWTLGKTEAQLRAEISQAMTKIHRHFLETIGGEDEQDVQEHWTMSLWHDYQEEDAKALLEKHGIDAEKLWPMLHQWREHTLRRAIGPRGRDTLDRLMPKLLANLFEHQQPCDAFTPVTKVLDQILTRTTYLELLCENPGARQQLVRLCCASPWIAEQLARYPMLLDELIDPVQLYATTELDDYSADLRQYLLRIPEDDMEQQMEALRQFKLSRQLKIAAADITGILPVMQVSDHLTHLAQAIIEQAVHYAWQQVSSRHGIPTHLQGDERGFAVIGYGKLGGMELGYGSDLDLVFLHNAAQGIQTNGDRSIDASHFYLKLAQRILHLFSTRTLSGALYEVDMRLRPSGSSGLLVSEIDNFSHYQINEAWTWEHQALVRARFVNGDKLLAQRFNAIRTQVLSTQRDKELLKTEVQQMRLKMREHLLKVPDEQFDLKQSSGGIADIEFIAQYLVLAYSHTYPELTFWSDNVRIFNKLCELRILSKLDAELLATVYCLLRDESHHLVLQGLSTQLPAKQIESQISGIKRIYQRLFGVYISQ